MTDQPEKAPQVGERASASASSSGGEWLEIVERFAEATKDRRTIRDAYAAECLRRIVGKVSSPSAALPDVRALIAEAVYDSVSFISRVTSLRIADAVMAALRSREGERAEPADAKPTCENCGKPVLCDDRDGVWFHDDGLGPVRCDGRTRIDGKPSPRKEVAVPRLRPAQPEEAAQRADFEAFKQRLLARSEHDGPGPYPHELDPEYEADLREAFEAGAASQRPTPSAPTPADEKRAALADPPRLPKCVTIDHEEIDAATRGVFDCGDEREPASVVTYCAECTATMTRDGEYTITETFATPEAEPAQRATEGRL